VRKRRELGYFFWKK